MPRGLTQVRNASVPIGGLRCSTIWGRWFFGVLLAAHLCDLPETAAKQVASLRGVPDLYRIVEPVFLAIAVTGLVTSRRAIHALWAPLWLVTLLIYLICSSLDRIAVS